MDVIVVTGLPQNNIMMEAKRLGACDFVSKPFEPDELKLLVQRVMGHRTI